MNFKNVLVLAPHTDDGEFGCGGTISRLADNGAEITYVAFSSCEESVPKEFDSNITKKELKEATRVLGISGNNVILHDFKVRFFAEYRQSILEELVSINNKLNPDLILLPSLDDCHQDHNTIAKEGFRAFKRSSILGYEMPWNNKIFPTTCFVKLKKEDIDKKVNAIKCYKSQEFRTYAREDFIKNLASVRGVQAGTKFAESFEVIRWII